MPRFMAFEDLSDFEQDAAVRLHPRAGAGDGFTYELHPDRGVVGRTRTRLPPMLDALPDEALYPAQA